MIYFLTGPQGSGQKHCQQWVATPTSIPFTPPLHSITHLFALCFSKGIEMNWNRLAHFSPPSILASQAWFTVEWKLLLDSLITALYSCQLNHFPKVGSQLPTEWLLMCFHIQSWGSEKCSDSSGILQGGPLALGSVEPGWLFILSWRLTFNPELKVDFLSWTVIIKS